ncbi:MAG: DUF4349 domain-containing protein [Leptospirales bacterium]
MKKIKLNDKAKSEKKITDRTLERFILGDLPARRHKEITKLAADDLELSARIQDLKVQKEKESKSFLKKFSAQKMMPLIQAKADQSETSRSKESVAKPFYLRPAVIGSFSVVVLVALSLTGQSFLKNNDAWFQTKNMESPMESPASPIEATTLEEYGEFDERELPIGGEVQSRGPNKDDDTSSGKMKAEKSEYSDKPLYRKSGEKDLGQIYFDPKNPEYGERLLEYQVQLTFEVDNFVKARHDLFRMANEYGYISESTASEESTSYMQTVLYVRSSQLNEFLLKVENLGRLTYEEINAIDHTENNEWQKRRIQRENIRSFRRKKALQGTPARKNWQERENALAHSEDNLDKAEQEKWKIKDKITWARVQVTLYPPQEGPAVKLPLYKETLIAMANFFLALSNVLLYLAPVGLLLFFLYRFWKKYRDSRHNDNI